MTRFIAKTVCITVLALSLFFPVCYAEPTAQVKSMMGAIVEVQTDPELQQQEQREKRLAAIKEIISANIDFDAKAKIALGDYWQELDAKQKQEFIDVFQYLFQDSYSRLVLNFIGREEVEYRKQDVEDARARVYTAIIKANDEIAVDYALIKCNGQWIVEDITVDGVSIAGNYNRSFTRVIRAQSYDGLLERMKLQKKAIGMQ